MTGVLRKEEIRKQTGRRKVTERQLQLALKPAGEAVPVPSCPALTSGVMTNFHFRASVPSTKRGLGGG